MRHTSIRVPSMAFVHLCAFLIAAFMAACAADVGSVDEGEPGALQEEVRAASCEVPAAAVNLAFERPVTVSSVEATGLHGTLAVDGNPATRWSSAFSDPQWISVDLGASIDIGTVVLTWETAYAKAYEIQVSDDQLSWTTIYATSDGAGGTETLCKLTGHGRYLRVYGTKRGTPWGYSLWEIAIYGADRTKVLRIDSGSKQNYIDTLGNVWLADRGCVGANLRDEGNIPIANTTDPRIYQTDARGMSACSFPVANGSYDVRLHFAEKQVQKVGQRVFSIDVEGHDIANLDVLAEAGGRDTALVKTVSNVLVNDGVLDLAFVAASRKPFLSGIEILPAALPEPPPDTVRINFQPASATPPPGYAADTGAPYGERGNGLRYGWVGGAVTTVQRGVNADVRYDTFALMMENAPRTWEIAVEPGAYDLHIVMGDPTSTNQKTASTSKA